MMSNYYPNTTYRLQFNPDFTFDSASTITDYLVNLGISHIYASPYFQASSGSTHGYDIVDPGRVNSELGGKEGHEKFCAALKEQGLGQILDVVPNHMSIAGTDNAWWWDVLENGPSSRYANYFDVEWDKPDAWLSNKVIMPILNDHYGCLLDTGDIFLEHDGGNFTVRYQNHTFPLAPRSLSRILFQTAKRSSSDELAFIADAFENLPLPTATDKQSTSLRHRNKEVLRNQLKRLLIEDKDIAIALDQELKNINSNPNALDDLLESQNYRLCFWRMAERNVGYRRFFDINTLVKLHIEDEEVFADTHHLVLEWLQKGIVAGLRIDHVDGLRDPEQYCAWLRKTAPEAWIGVEKILHRDEEIPSSWEVDGTTGYDFMNLLGGVFISPDGEKPLTKFYVDFTGETVDYSTLTRQKKLKVMNEILDSDISYLTKIMKQICERHRRFRDYSSYEIKETLRETIANFPVYRTYLREHVVKASQKDRDIIDEAITKAKIQRSEIDPVLFDFLGDLLLLKWKGDYELELVMRFQQFTASVMAKGVEDTAFYCFNRFVALNEVGGDPDCFGTPMKVFHRAMMKKQKHYPCTMLSTTTHDCKRSGDVRARLALLSEIPDDWAEAVRRWSDHNDQYHRGGFPDRNIEYLIYQTLVGAWPISFKRMCDYMEKAVREAKTYTSWVQQDRAYEEAIRFFLESIYKDPWFQGDLEIFVKSLVAPGRINSLAQTLVKLTAPGVPDIYQGSELWDLSLVDPDNRRPVDYQLRRRLLAEIEGKSVEEITERMEEGLPKLWVIWKTLNFRKEHPHLFGPAGTYRRLVARGMKASHVFAFVRAEEVVTIVPRLIITLAGNWGKTKVELPLGAWENVFSGELFEGGKILVKDLLERFPVALICLKK